MFPYRHRVSGPTLLANILKRGKQGGGRKTTNFNIPTSIQREKQQQIISKWTNSRIPEREDKGRPGTRGKYNKATR